MTVRIGPAPSQRSTPTASTQSVSVNLGDPVQLAVAARTRHAALRMSHSRSNDHGIDFQATTDATGDVISLAVITPTRIATTTLARDWAIGFADARRAEARRQILEDQQNLNLRATKLHSELLRVDTQLVKLAPNTYKDLLRYDGGYSNLGRLTPPPPVPEQASVKVLNLAFERIQLLTSLTQSGTRAADLRISAAAPEVFAQIVSQTPAVQINPPHRNGNTATTFMAIGLLLGGLALATTAFLLGRHRRPVQPAS